MVFKSRKFFVWLISLGAVLAIYLFYIRLSGTPRIDIDTEARPIKQAADSNVGRFGSEVGMIGEVGVRTVQKAKFTHLNSEREVDREFGFEKLLHDMGGEWEIEKPYMNIFRRDFKCYITADKGKVRVETATSRPGTKDATFTGNVVVHILPENEGPIKESFIYLDDIVFISEKSQFSTAGPVKFISKDAEMLGTGLELVYNDEADRLEFLKIVDLESLHLKTSSKRSLFSSPQTNTAGSKQQTANNERRATSDEQRASSNYRCVFSRNVVIDTPEQLVFADELSINNIQRHKPTGNQGIRKSWNQGKNHEPQATSHEPRPVFNGRDEPRVTSHDIVVTCDGGILVTPMDSPLKPGAVATEDKKPKSFDEAAGGRTTFVARKIDYSASAGNVVASGPSQLTFYANDMTGAETVVPVKITARKKVEFQPALNQALFEGDTLCTMIQEDPNSQQRYMLSAPKLTVNLTKDKASPTDIEHLTADGGVVRLATVKTAAEKLLGGIELKCRKFDYDSGQQMFLATGPGVIKVDNSMISEPDTEGGRFSLQRPGYAFVRDFETLKFFLEANRIIADAGDEETLRIDYIPIVEGQGGQYVIATARKIEALLYETADGRLELSTLSAAGGITYEEQADENKKRKGKRKNIQFVGSEFFYDADKSVITAWGDESQPCLLNGAFVDGIKYDLKTGKIKTKLVGPGILQMKR